jgi:hypothetical protein
MENEYLPQVAAAGEVVRVEEVRMTRRRRRSSLQNLNCEEEEKRAGSLQVCGWWKGWRLGGKQQQWKAGVLLGLYKACPAQVSALLSCRPALVCLGQLEWTRTNQRS